MIKHAIQAKLMADRQLKDDCELYFEVNPDTKSEEYPNGIPRPVLKQKNPIIFPEGGPNGVLYGAYMPGEVPANNFVHEEMQKEWAVVRSNADPKIAIRDYWPPMTTPIVVMMEGRQGFAYGILINYRSENKGGWVDNEQLFVELIPRGQKLPSLVVFPGIVRWGEHGNVQNELFAAHEFNKIVAWNYLGVDGEMILPKKEEEFVELFADCEFDDSTKSLISLGITTAIGKTYYAFSTARAHDVKEQWIIDNVNSVLFEIPPSTSNSWNLTKSMKSFSDFLQFVLEQEDSGLYKNVRIHVDFPTDVGYIAPLLHLGEGKRIGKMSKVQFHIDYVDSYPTKVPNAVQHNAAWDSVALWHHLGYYEFLVGQRFLQEAGRVYREQEKFEKTMAEANQARAEHGLSPLVVSKPDTPAEPFPRSTWDQEVKIEIPESLKDVVLSVGSQVVENRYRTYADGTMLPHLKHAEDLHSEEYKDIQDAIDRGKTT